MNSNPKTLNAVAVNLYGRRIGVISRLGGDRYLFAFEQQYLDDPERPTLSLSFKGENDRIIVPTRTVATRLPEFFSNLLPEGHLRNYLAARAGVKPQREFFLLAVLGPDLPGAITITPADDDSANSLSIDLEEQADHTTKPVLRFSLAGVQLKFSAIMEASGGLTIPAGGIGGSWILKLPSARFAAVPENEYAMMALARSVGIEVPRTKLVDINEIQGLPDDAATLEGKALIVERFDRLPGGERVHIEDFAQVFGIYPEDKYERRSYANIAAVLWAETGDAGTYEFVRRLAFSILIGNADMHLKNWSLIYRDRRAPQLSPGYDFVATIPYIPNDKLALSLGGEKSLDEITSDQLRRFAEVARIPSSSVLRLITDTADRTVAAWEQLAEKDELPDNIRDTVQSHIQLVAGRLSRISR